ncbi:MAG: ABC transporter permease [Alphaproteobacteria bacterium]
MRMRKTILTLVALGGLGFLILPWYATYDGFFSFIWLTDGYPYDEEYAPAILQIISYGRWWLAPMGLALIPPLITAFSSLHESKRAYVYIVSGCAGLLWMIMQSLAINIDGLEFAFLRAIFGNPDIMQEGMGMGATITSVVLISILSYGLARRGAVNGDVFVVASITLIVALIALFIFFPITTILKSAFETPTGVFQPSLVVERFANNKVWGLSCLSARTSCGVAWNSLFLAVSVALSTTILGAAFALLMQRTAFKAKWLMRVFSILPIITPPFVIGMALILIFGQSGTVTVALSNLLGIEPSRWMYGFWGIFIAQTLSFTPIAFMVLMGVVDGISVSMEEASQTLGADRWKTFNTVTFPLMRPGFANAFLLGFIESLADFGNPLVLGGNYDVLSTDIFFTITGAQADYGRGAVLSFILLTFTLSAFFLQRWWMGKKSYATVTGKADQGIPPELPKGLQAIIYCLTIPFVIFTFAVYLLIVYGGFVKLWGRDNTLTLEHYRRGFSFDFSDGLNFTGAAWDSLFVTLKIALLSAPITAALGLLTAWLLIRQRFAGKNIFEFGTMLSFAIPGTVIGVSYVLAFNIPPIEITGTALILIICFVFRNMPVGVRAGVASMSQLDASLDEASITLGASSAKTLQKVVLPLLRPAIITALVYSFVRAMTAISAVIFLISADYNLSTAYIIGRVENGDYGIAIAYSTVLIFVMLAAIIFVQLAVGKRKLRARSIED